MKKLIALAVAATCGAALAVESANIVGYQNQDLTGQVAPSIGATFAGVGADTFKLGDIAVEGFQYDTETLQNEYMRDKKGYFLITEDYEAYKEYMAEKNA